MVSSEKHNEDFSNLYRVPLAHPENLERLTVQPDFGQFPGSWSKKANAILLMEGRHEVTNGDILVLPLAGHQLPKKSVANPGWDRAPSFSPNGKFFVYESEVRGRSEVFVRRYDAETASAEGEPIQISPGGGHDPLWSPKGDRLVYTDSLGNLMEVKLAAKASLPVILIKDLDAASQDLWTRKYSIAPDGRILFLRPVS